MILTPVLCQALLRLFSSIRCAGRAAIFLIMGGGEYPSTVDFDQHEPFLP